MKKSIKLTDDSLILCEEDKVIYQVQISKILWYSDCRPWEYSAISWKRTGKKQEGKENIFYYTDGKVSVELRISMVNSYLKMNAVFINTGETALKHFAAGLNLPVTEEEGAVTGEPHKITIPHLIYNDNPSAEEDRIVAHVGNVPGQGIVVEEHRLPIPGVNVEWQKEEEYHFLTIMSFPEVVDGEDEEYWSLGALRAHQGEQIIALSGPLMFNGMKDVAYIGRCIPLSWLKGYRVLEKGQAIEKNWYLDWGGLVQEGKGFRSLVNMGYDLLRPVTVPQHTMKEMIAYKSAVLDTRYYKSDYCEGYQTFGAANQFGNISGRPEYFLYGWTGQAIKLSWCDCMQGIQTCEEALIHRGIRTADFWVQKGESHIPGLYYGYYLIEKNSWQGDYKDSEALLSSRIEGEAASDLARLLLLLRENGRGIPQGWDSALRRICDFLMDSRYQTSGGIYPFGWTKDGIISNDEINAAGISCVVALAYAAEYFKKEEYLEYACEKCERYADNHVKTFRIPFAKATLDARCEDKEAGLYFFAAAAKLYEMTGQKRFKEYADYAGDWILTFVYHWDTGFMQGTDCWKKGFKTTGWPGVSVQNHHLDVFFPVYELYHYGKITDNHRFMEMAGHVRDALTYGVCTEPGEWGYTVIGEQGEQYYQTNYFQNPYPNVLRYLRYMRGGMQCWNPSWITAQVMSGALMWSYVEGEE